MGEYAKNYYEENKEQINKDKKDRDVRERAFVNKLKDVPCADCGVEYPHYVMQFDHVPERGEKEFQIGPNVGRFSLSRVLKEIEKCDVVCANCHCERTWHRRQSDVKPT